METTSELQKIEFSSSVQFFKLLFFSLRRSVATIVFIIIGAGFICFKFSVFFLFILCWERLV